ncbi:hypothetical protein POM88_041040 [Heracleum sosnowskyi]|uniref:Uncharacterized protein n=1 Tax=Heracleum sosnowskyi TaxID=360622 RepID=A0AAD8MAB7_9APIA|nr:hypothetical protein POM88_041040 [Heracleum sosnowskyi]
MSPSSCKYKNNKQITSPPISPTANVILSSGDGTATYCNIDYAPLNDLRAAVLAATGHTNDSLPPPTTMRLFECSAKQPLWPFQNMMTGSTTLAQTACVEFNLMDKIGPEAPPVLNNMVAKKCLFEVKITSYNTPGHDCYTIARLYETQPAAPTSVPEPSKQQKDIPETSNKDGTETSKKQRIS